jgi:hypothetical protein
VNFFSAPSSSVYFIESLLKIREEIFLKTISCAKGGIYLDGLPAPPDVSKAQRKTDLGYTLS